MNPYCPLCETDLDPATGICPACRWQHVTARAQPEKPSPERVSLTERYRGTEWDSSFATISAPSGHQGISRGRLFVLAGLLLVVGVYGAVVATVGLPV